MLSLLLTGLMFLEPVAPGPGQPIFLSPHAVVGPVGLTEVRWTEGFWAQHFATCQKTMVPAMGLLMAGTERSQFLRNFQIASGLETGKHRGPPWNDGDFYKWLEAAAAIFSVSRDPQLDAQLDQAIAVIAQAQRDDGYLHTPVLIARRNGDLTVQPFQDRLNFEMYNFGHLMTAACVHHRATGKRNLLEVAIKAANYLCKHFATPTPELARNSVCPSHYMATVELYRLTREEKYLTLAKTFLTLRDSLQGGTDDNQDRISFRKQTEAVGHAVRANYLYAGVADLYQEIGDRTLLSPLERIWANLVSRKMSLTGGCGALYDGASPDGSKDQKQIARIHQAYGRDYQIPQSTAHNETCAAIGNILWNTRMLHITGEVCYADVLETTLYNALLAGVSLDGRRFFYTNTLRQLNPMPAPLRWSRTREEWISCYCCPPNVARTIAQAHTLAYGRSPRGVWIHLYGGSTLDTRLPEGGRVALRQETEYPWSEQIRIHLTAVPDHETSLFLRIPSWAREAKISVNGQEEACRPGHYAELRRVWKIEDVIELRLPLTPRLMESHPLAEETRNQVAVMRGPLVYCLESPDLPPGIGLMNVAIPREIRWTPRFDRETLGGVVLLSGAAEVHTDSSWGTQLYRELRPGRSRPLDVRLIPYYAWANRGPSEMTVWLPLGR